jgi:hypothetical protein
VKKSYSMELNVVQLELEENSITIKTEVLKGVLTSKTFSGGDCYLQLLRFIKQGLASNTAINATIFVR